VRRFQRLSKGEVLFGLGLALAAFGAAILQAELRAKDPTACWIIASVVAVVLGLILLAVIAYEHFTHQHDVEGSPEVPDPCAERLKRAEANANHLANQLGNFDNWWWALQNDELPDGHPMPRAKAMEELIFRFTRFFSAAWLYEDHCREHQPHDEVVEWLREIYGPFGKPKNGSSDDRIMSQELHAIGEAGTNDWGTAQVRLKSEAEVKNAIDDNVFDPLRRFLSRAGPDTEVLARLEIVREVLERAEERKKLR
jgi:hypothetical protein